MIKKNFIKIAVPLVAGGVFVTPLFIVLIHISQNIIHHPEQLTYFTSLSFLKKILNSFLLSSTVSGATVLSGVFLAYLFFGLQRAWQRVGMLFFLLIIFSISPVIYLIALTKFELFNQLPGFWQAVSVLTFNMSPLPFVIFVFSAGVLNRSSLEAAFLNATPGSVYRHIIIPQLFCPFVIAALIIFMFVFNHEEVPSFLGYRTYAEEFLSRIVVMTDLQEAPIAALPFLLTAFPVAGALIWLAAKTHLYSFINQTYKPLSFTFQTNKNILLSGCVFLTITIPGILFILCREIDISSIPSMAYDNVEALRHSLFLALISAGIATISACGLYNFLSGEQKRFIIIPVITILLFYRLVPSSLTALGVIGFSQIFNIHSQIYDFLLLLFGYQTNLLPVAVLVLAAVQLINRKQEDIVTKVLKVSKRDIFTKLTFPRQWPIWLLTTTILTVFALNDLSVTVLLIPPGIETVIIKIYNLMHYGDYTLTAFLSLAQILMVSLIILLTAVTIRRYDKT